MKRTLIISFSLLLATLIFLGTVKIWKFAEGMKQDIIHLDKDSLESSFYKINIPPGLDTIRFVASIKLDSTKKLHFLEFPSGGTGTRVLLFDSLYFQAIQKTSEDSLKPLLNKGSSTNQFVILNISKLSPGKYFIHYLSCNNGGIFPLEIK